MPYQLTPRAFLRSASVMLARPAMASAAASAAGAYVDPFHFNTWPLVAVPSPVSNLFTMPATVLLHAGWPVVAAVTLVDRLGPATVAPSWFGCAALPLPEQVRHQAAPKIVTVPEEPFTFRDPAST